MVVVLIIGILLTLLPLTMAPSGGQLKQEAKRIYGLMDVAKEEAIINAQEMAFTVGAKKIARFPEPTSTIILKT